MTSQRKSDRIIKWLEGVTPLALSALGHRLIEATVHADS